MSSNRADRNLLIGVLALQMNFVERHQLIEAMADWFRDQHLSLDNVLLKRNYIDSAAQSQLRSVVEIHLANHANDPAKSLATLSMARDGLIGDFSTINRNMASLLTSIEDRPDARSGTSTEEQSMETIELPSHRDTEQRRSHQFPESDRFRVLRDHAQGGLGKVSVAVDNELDREVALKEILSRHADSPETRSRFVAEAKITGQLEHPGIVPVYALSAHDDGRPFYAMRFIRGDSLKQATEQFFQQHGKAERADFQGVEFRKLLGRLIDACNAIEYAHSRGVIHRDIKPDNIMVGEYGESLVVDWGLAKVLGSDREEVTGQAIDADSNLSVTQVGSIVGTPAFMSPEQANGDIDKIGKSSDVYSLGATLFYLLTGRPPFSKLRLNELLDKVREGEFPQPRSIQSGVPKALEAICTKAMAVDIDNRYESAGALAEDVEKWLADEPVNAYPEPLPTRAWRWVRRHQSFVTSVAAITLVATLSLFVVLAVIADSNRQLTSLNTELDEKNELLGKTVTDLEESNRRVNEEKENVVRERDIARAINEFVNQDLLGQASPNQTADRDIKLRTVLDRAADSIGERFRDQPLVEAAIALTIGATYRDLGWFELAQPHLDRSLELRIRELGEEDTETRIAKINVGRLAYLAGDFPFAERIYSDELRIARNENGSEHRKTIAAANNLALVYQSQGRYAEAEELLAECLSTAERLLGSRDAYVQSIKNNLALILSYRGRYQESLDVTQKVLEDSQRSGLGAEHPISISSRNNLVACNLDLARFEEAELLLNENIECSQRVLGKEHTSTINATNQRIELYLLTYRFAEAEALARENLETCRRRFGERHINTLSTISRLLAACIQLGRIDEAVQLATGSIQVSAGWLGNEHPMTLALRWNLVQIYLQQEKSTQALEIIERDIAITRLRDGDGHIKTIQSMQALASVFKQLRDYDKAEQYFVQTMEQARSSLGHAHPTTLSAMESYASFLANRGRYDDAMSLLNETTRLSEELFGQDHIFTHEVKIAMGIALSHVNRLDDAARLLRESARRFEEAYGMGHPTTLRARIGLALVQSQVGQFLEAEENLTATLDSCRENLGPNHERTIRAATVLATVHFEQGNIDKAKPIFLEILETSRRKLGDDSPETASIRSNLGNVYHALREYEKALELYQDSYESSLRVHGQENAETLVTLNNYAAIHRSLNRFDEAAALYDRLIELSLRVHGEVHPTTVNAKNGLAVVYWRQGDLDRSIPLFEECVKTMNSAAGESHPATLAMKMNLGINYRDAGRYQEAAELLYEARKKESEYIHLKGTTDSLLSTYVRGQMKTEGKIFVAELVLEARDRAENHSDQLASSLAYLGRQLVLLEAWEEAVEILRESVMLQTDHAPEAWQRYDTQSLLGEALAGQGLTDEAQSQLIEAHEGLMRLESTIPENRRKRVRESAVRLAQFYKAINDTEQASRWQQIVDSFDE